MKALESYVYVWLQSNLIEIPIFWWLYRHRLGLRDSAKLTSVANAMTHPVVFFVFMAVRGTWIRTTLVSEIYAFVMESLLHKLGTPRLHWRDTILASLVANLASWQVAPILTWWLFY